MNVVYSCKGKVHVHWRAHHLCYSIPQQFFQVYIPCLQSLLPGAYWSVLMENKDTSIIPQPKDNSLQPIQPIRSIPLQVAVTTALVPLLAVLYAVRAGMIGAVVGLFCLYCRM